MDDFNFLSLCCSVSLQWHTYCKVMVFLCEEAVLEAQLSENWKRALFGNEMKSLRFDWTQRCVCVWFSKYCTIQVKRCSAQGDDVVFKKHTPLPHDTTLLLTNKGLIIWGKIVDPSPIKLHTALCPPMMMKIRHVSLDVFRRLCLLKCNFLFLMRFQYFHKSSRLLGDRKGGRDWWKEVDWEKM